MCVCVRVHLHVCLHVFPSVYLIPSALKAGTSKTKQRPDAHPPNDYLCGRVTLFKNIARTLTTLRIETSALYTYALMASLYTY